MDKNQAKTIIKDTFESKFDKLKFKRFIVNLLNIKSSMITDPGVSFNINQISNTYQPFIDSFEKIAEYKSNNNKVDVLAIRLKKETSIERARTMQRNFIAWYLRGNCDGEIKDAALAAFISPDENDWRFSLIKLDYSLEEDKKGKPKISEKLTPAKRWSFLVGANEKSHTAQSQLIDIVARDDEDITLGQLEEAFDVEKVTKEFFKKYRELFLKTKEALDKILLKDDRVKSDFESKNINTVDFSKKLLGQIVFLYFLQKKGWFGVERDADWGTGPKNFLQELFGGKHGKYKNFFNDILEPLFYNALRVDRSANDDYHDKFNCKIPFLNGGLFDPIGEYDWVHTDINLPNELFSNNKLVEEEDGGTGILDIFDRYNFTVKEDEPLEKEVAVDPEMLGKVFENLLEVKDRKSKGTYYTPREIVHYMCQQSLINYLATELEGKVSQEDIELFFKYGEQFGENNTELVDNLDENGIPESIIKNADLIDNKLLDIKVCDPAVGSGAFLVGVMAEIVRARNILSFYINDSDRTIYNFKRECIENSLYGVDIDLGAVEIAKLRLWLSLVVDEEDIKKIKPLPNLDYKIVCGNSLMGIEKNLFNQGLFSELESLKKKFFDEISPIKKKELKDRINEKIFKITNGHKEFDFEVYFSEVFHTQSGFNIVIANPPYIKEYVNRSSFDGLRESPYYQGKMDIWYFFICKGIDLIKDKGILTFIAQNNWVTSYGASKMRRKVLSDCKIIELLDFGDYKIFENTGIQTMIMIFQKNIKSNFYEFDYRRLNYTSEVSFNDVLDLLEKNENYHVDYLTPLIKKKYMIDNVLTFGHERIEKLLNKIAKTSNFKLNEKEATNGIHHHHGIVNIARQKILGDDFKVGQGIFLLNDAEKNSIQLTKEELKLIKPAYTTKELFKYYANPKNKYWVIYTDSTFKNYSKMKNYPNIKEHLDKFKKVITSDNKPYGLHRARDQMFFIGEKIISVRKCNEPTFTFVDFDSYVSAAFYIIKTNRVDMRYLTAILNSKLIAFWLKYKGKMQGNNYQIDKEPLLKLPLLKPHIVEQQIPLIKEVEKILNLAKFKKYESSFQDNKEFKIYNHAINSMVYKLYHLNEEEIKFIEKEIPNVYKKD